MVRKFPKVILVSETKRGTQQARERGRKEAKGEIILVAVLLTIGYFFGQLYASIAGGLKIVFIIGAALLSFVVLFGVSKYFKNKIAN